MKINISKEKLLDLILNDKISLNEIESEDKKEFITQYGSLLLLNAFKNNEYQQLEYLLSEEQIRKKFLSYIKGTISSAEISYVDNLSEIMNFFILSMSRQNIQEKQNFFNVITEFCLENPIEMTRFFNLRTNITWAGFEKDIPIGMHYLKVAEKNVNKLLDLNIISKNLFSLTKKTTLIHYLHLYPYETSKYLIDNIDLNSTLKDRDDLNHTPLDNLISDLRVKNVDLITYLFKEKIEIDLFKKEFITYVVKSANILRNKQTKQSLRDNIMKSLEDLFNFDEIQNNEELKQNIAKNICQKVTPEIQYLWLNAKLKGKPVVKKIKI